MKPNFCFKTKKVIAKKKEKVKKNLEINIFMSPINTSQYLLQNNNFYEELGEINFSSNEYKNEFGSMLSNHKNI